MKKREQSRSLLSYLLQNILFCRHFIKMGKSKEERKNLILDSLSLRCQFESKITVDSDCSHEIKGHLLLGRKAMMNLDNVLKSRGIILATKVCIVKAIIFSVVMYGCESWTIKKDAFELWCCRRLLRVPWTARR